jgi:hypothetical protein
MGAGSYEPNDRAVVAVEPSASTFARLNGADPAWSRLSDDVQSGAWAARYASLLPRAELDVGYRLVVASCRT